MHGTGIMVYDPIIDKWDVLDGTALPHSRQGACSLVWNKKILIVGGNDGANQQEDQLTAAGSDQVWEFDPESKKWNQDSWPPMKWGRYYHGCTIGTLNGIRG